MSFGEETPLGRIYKKIAELEKEKVRVTAAIDTYNKLFEKIYADEDTINLSDLLKLQELGSK